MAGFLSPQISEVGGVQGIPAQRSITDTSVGDAMKNAASIFDAVISSTQGNGTTSTQTDRDRLGLQKYTSRIRKIGQRVKSGQMSATEGNARVSQLVIEAGTVYPDKLGDMRDFASGVMGSEILNAAEDPMVQAKNALIGELTNFDDPRNTRIMRQALLRSRNEDGVVDEDRFLAVGAELLAKRDAQAARNASLQDEVTRLELNNQLNDEKRTAISQEVFPQWVAETEAVVEELTASFAAEGAQIDISEALQSVINIRAELMGRFTEQAAELRITNNLRDTFGGIEEALRPLTIIENQLRNSRQEDVDAAQARATLAPDRFAKALHDAGLGAGIAYTDIGQEMAAKHLLSKNSDKVASITGDQVDSILTFSDNPFYEGTKGQGGIDTAGERQGSDTVMNPDGQTYQLAADRDEAKRMVKSGISGFLLKDDYDNLTEKEQRFTVDNFVIGLEVMTNKGLNFDEASFDRLYGSDKFYDTYNNVIEKGGPQANVLNNGIRRHLRSQRLLKEADVNADLNAVEEMPGAELVFDGTKYTIQLPSLPRTDAEEAVLNMLKENDLPRTLEGLKQLRAPRTTLPRGMFSGEEEAAFRAIPQIINQTRDNLRLLNKIAGTVPKLAEDAQAGILPSGTGGRTENVIEVSDRESLQNEFDKAPDGTIFETRSEDGSVFRAQKINGQLVPFGGR